MVGDDESGFLLTAIAENKALVQGRPLMLFIVTTRRESWLG